MPEKPYVYVPSREDDLLKSCIQRYRGQDYFEKLDRKERRARRAARAKLIANVFATSSEEDEPPPPGQVRLRRPSDRSDSSEDEERAAALKVAERTDSKWFVLIAYSASTQFFCLLIKVEGVVFMEFALLLLII